MPRSTIRPISSAIEMNSDGEVSRVVGTLTDVTDIKNAEERMQTPLRQRFGEKIYKIRAMEVVVRRAEGSLDFGPEWSTLQDASIVPAPLMHRAWPRAEGVHRGPEAQPQQDPRGVGADLDACADFGDVRRLLIDVNVEACAHQ